MSVTICDVGPRDGLQNQPVTLAPGVRAELVNLLAAAGVPRIEATSFVSERHVPQMAGAEEVVAGIDRREDVTYAGLVLNERGYDRLVESGLDEVHVTFAASDEFSQRNAGMSTEEGVHAAERILARASKDGIRATTTISVSFGCPFAGAVDPARVEELAGRVVRAGTLEVAVADTIGVGVPAQVRDLVGRLLPLGVPVGIHLHNTRNTGYANAYAALEAGATVFDASVGGIGGCPFAPRATGNIATEDLVYLLHGQGVETGIDLERLIEASRWLENRLGRELEGQVYKAGTFAPVAGRRMDATA
jgi:hydroxymethylglutaryl-CoA lyase/(R)-citramalyl-CoA lyase